MFKKLIGDKNFYKHVLILMLPIMVQNGITNFVNMLDNLMVGQVGQIEMIGVSVSNQLMFVFNLCIFGAVSGIGIFGAQFFGSGDIKGLRDTFRLKIVFCTSLTVAVMVLFAFGGEGLINLYLKGEGTAEEAAASLKAGKDYLNIMLIGLIPATLVQCYSTTLRETGKTVPPMAAGLIAVFVNLILNYILIFGRLGFPTLGVKGAAIATVISRFVEFGVISLWTGIKSYENKFIIDAYKTLYVPFSLVKKIAKKAIPLVINETMWAGGLAVVNQSYSSVSLDVVAANNLVQTFFNVFSVAFLAVGAAIGIILGQLLGAGETEEARSASVKLIAFSVFISIGVAILFAVCAIFIPDFYKLDESTKLLSTRMMQICALVIPLDAFANAAYFTLRSGGEAMITIIFDSGFVWAVSVPAAYILCNFSGLSILPIYLICQLLNFIKDVIGFIFVKKGIWVKNIVS